MNKRIVLTVAQIGLIPVVAAGLWLAAWWWVIVGLVMFYVFACVGVSVTYHRLLSHRAFKAPRWFLLTGSFFALVGFLLSPVEWAGQHEDHHKFVDAASDPHAPRVHGYKVALYAFHGEGKPGMVAGRVVLDPALAWMHRYFWLMLGGYVGLCAALAGWHGVVFLWAMPSLLTLWSGIAGVFMHGRDGALDRGWFWAVMTMASIVTGSTMKTHAIGRVTGPRRSSFVP